MGTERSKGRRRLAGALVLAAFLGGLAWGQDGDASGKKDKHAHLSKETRERLAKVRREVKQLDLDDALKLVPRILERENRHVELVREMKKVQSAGGDITPLLKKGRELKLAALEDYNRVLKKHKSEFTGISEKEVHERLRTSRFRDVYYEDEWLVNILDDLEEACRINIEIDARVYKFDTVSFEFERVTARAMLQMMADALMFKWIVRGDTLYVYKERNEILFGAEWRKKKKEIAKLRKKALEKAEKEAEKEALEKGDAGGGEKEDADGAKGGAR